MQLVRPIRSRHPPHRALGARPLLAADTDRNQATTKKLHVGVVLNYYPKPRIAQIAIQDQPVALGDALSIHGPTTGVVDLTVTDLRHDEEVRSRAERGTWITVPCPERVRANDKVFVVTAC